MQEFGSVTFASERARALCQADAVAPGVYKAVQQCDATLFASAAARAICQAQGHDQALCPAGLLMPSNSDLASDRAREICRGHPATAAVNGVTDGLPKEGSCKTHELSLLRVQWMTSGEEICQMPVNSKTTLKRIKANITSALGIPYWEQFLFVGSSDVTSYLFYADCPPGAISLVHQRIEQQLSCGDRAKQVRALGLLARDGNDTGSGQVIERAVEQGCIQPLLELLLQQDLFIVSEALSAVLQVLILSMGRRHGSSSTSLSLMQLLRDHDIDAKLDEVERLLACVGGVDDLSLEMRNKLTELRAHLV